MVTSEIADYSGLNGTPSDYFSPTSVAQLKDFLKNNPLKAIRIGGGLSGVSGGAVPLSHECFLDVSKLTAIEWYDEDAGIIQCEAGVTMYGYGINHNHTTSGAINVNEYSGQCRLYG